MTWEQLCNIDFGSHAWKFTFVDGSTRVTVAPGYVHGVGFMDANGIIVATSHQPSDRTTVVSVQQL